jgi:hypothetical protein
LELELKKPIDDADDTTPAFASTRVHQASISFQYPHQTLSIYGLLSSIISLLISCFYLNYSKRPNHGDRNTKHGRGGRAPPRDGKRAYDRRSGTGRGKEVKKGGGGARNWGSDKEQAKKAEGAIDEAAVEEKVEEEVEVAPEPEPEPEDNTMTFAEYMASKKKASDDSNAAALKVDNEFSGKAGLKKEEEDFFGGGGGKAKKNKKKNAEKKNTVDVGFRVVSSSFTYALRLHYILYLCSYH